ncbi:MAG: PhoH family protein [Bacteroidales bacterium]|nr:PhoH family protein [Bacteroidales bacterium]MDD2324086.1 PhoH family protein [Bacteroidales bacterium]MDD3961583.1 PhoH family protein [Bacteroidales bacterium]MDY0285572.1 PhoH family protein [Bacteroidales bacterium]HPE86467.1 PhoH family protein [Bacteroidales bacterium]
MSEQIISLASYSPVEIYGVNDINLNVLRDLFPKLKIIARGEVMKIIGSEEDIAHFESCFDRLLHAYDTYGVIHPSELNRLVSPGFEKSKPGNEGPLKGDVLVYGRNGLMIQPRTENQRKMVKALEKDDMLFAIGPAGTGKTYTAVALAVRALKAREVKRIILTRPAVEAGENLGFLPGDLKEKLDPYLRPLYDALRDMLPAQKLSSYLEEGTIEIAPLAFMRGRTLSGVFAILDEAQNATPNQLKMFLTRMGIASKFVITGDITQIDLPPRQASGLVQSSTLLSDIEGINFVYLNEKDVVRHILVTRIIKAYASENFTNKKNNPVNENNQ